MQPNHTPTLSRPAPTPSGAPTLSRWKQRQLAKIAKRNKPRHSLASRRNAEMATIRLVVLETSHVNGSPLAKKLLEASR